MIKAIISKIIIVIILIFISLSAFWFFKTSVTKKQVLAMIESSNGFVSASSISVSGFPVQQIITIEGIKFKPFANLSFSKIPFNPEIEVKKLQGKAGILSGEFFINKLEGVSFKNKDGQDNFVEFNQSPKSKFLFVGGKLTKFSYQDFGYKVFDVAKNVLSENGNSSFTFDSISDGEKYRNKIKADLKDVAIFQIVNLQKQNTVTNLPEATANLPEEKAKIDANKTNEIDDKSKTDVTQKNPVENLKESDPIAINNVPSSNVKLEQTNQQLADNFVDSKKNFSIDIEYIISKPSSKPLAGLPSPDAQNPTIDIVQDKSNLQSLIINNFEISTPLYKINFLGQISAFQKDDFPVSNLSARIEKLDNVLAYIKRLNIGFAQENNINNSPNVNSNNNILANSNEQKPPVSDVPNSNMIIDNKESKIDLNKESKIDLVTAIKNLSKKNLATNEEIAVFDFRQEKGKDLIINEISLPEILSLVYSNNSSNVEKTNQNVSNENIPNVANQPLPSPPIPQPIKNNVPPQTR